MRVRQADIAREVGLSQPAVSVVLRGGGDRAGIPADTQQHVLDVARRLGYAPNPVAQNLQGARTKLLGVHTFEAVFPIDRHDYYYEFLLGIEEQAEQEGYDLVLFTSTSDSVDRRRHPYRAGANRLRLADGSVLLGRSDRSDLARLAEEHYPFVHIGRREVPGATIPYVSCDYAAATEQTVELLASRGHRFLGYLATAAPFEPQLDRRAGFRRAVREGNVAGHLEEVEDHAVTASWLRDLLDEGVSALVVETWGLAGALRAAARSAGVSIPANLSVAVLDHAGEVQGAPTPAWSCLEIPRAQLGRVAVRLLLERLTDPYQPVSPVVLTARPPGDESITSGQGRSS